MASSAMPTTTGAGPTGPETAIPGVTRSVWGQERVRPTRPPLTSNASADVCVVGGGLSGLCCALTLAKAGIDVVLLESRAIGAGMSTRASGTLTEWDAGAGGISRIASRHGAGPAAAVAASRRAAFDWLVSTVKEEGIDCGLQRVPGLLGGGGAGGTAVAKELEACHRAGLTTEKPPAPIDTAGAEAAPAGAPEEPPSATDMWPRGAGGSAAAAANGGAAAEGIAPLPGRAAQLDPLRLVQGLAAALERHRGRIYEGVRVKSGPFTISGKVCTLATNSTDGPVVRAKRGIVLATHSPINRSLAVHSRQSPWRTYSMTFDMPTGEDVPNLAVMLLDGHTARVVEGDGSRRLLLVGGGSSDHVAGQARERYGEAGGDGNPFAALERWARSAFPTAGRTVQRWSSVVFRPADLVGLYGANPLDIGYPKTRLITGTGGDAVMGAAVAAQVVAGEILGTVPEEWERVYSPSRLGPLLGSLGSLGDLGTEVGLNLRGYARVLAPTCWRDVIGLVAPGRVERGLVPGDGAVVQEGLRKVALYRDQEGTLHRRSALCPHMHVLLQWNPITSTFDCPGHGSVFDACGRCVSGPSSRDLEDLGWRREAEGRGEGGGAINK